MKNNAATNIDLSILSLNLQMLLSGMKDNPAIFITVSLFTDFWIFLNIQPKKGEKKTSITIPSCFYFHSRNILGSFKNEVKNAWLKQAIMFCPQKGFWEKPTECLILTHTCSTSSWKGVKVGGTWAAWVRCQIDVGQAIDGLKRKAINEPTKQKSYKQFFLKDKAFLTFLAFNLSFSRAHFLILF